MTMTSVFESWGIADEPGVIEKEVHVPGKVGYGESCCLTVDQDIHVTVCSHLAVSVCMLGSGSMPGPAPHPHPWMSGPNSDFVFVQAMSVSRV